MDMSKNDFGFYLLRFGEVLEFRGKEIKQKKNQNSGNNTLWYASSQTHFSFF